MIIPVRCFTCGQVVGSKYETYINEMNKYLNYGVNTDPLQSNPELKNFNNEKTTRYNFGNWRFNLFKM